MDAGVGAGAKGAVCPTVAVCVLYGGGRGRPPAVGWAIALTAGGAAGNARGASSKLTHPDDSASSSRYGGEVGIMRDTGKGP